MTHLIPLHEALGPIRDVYAHLLTAAALWQDGRERRTDTDHFALICVATDAGFGDHVSPTRWTRTDVYHVLRCDIPNCFPEVSAAASAAVPPSTSDAT